MAQANEQSQPVFLVREAVEDDFEAILDLCQVFWTYTVFPEEFERDHTLNMVRMASDHGLLAVLDPIVGFAAGIKSHLLGSTQAMMGTELAWWVDPLHRGNGGRLLEFMEGLAKREGVKYWNMMSMESSMPEAVGQMYEKMGYRHIETTYMKEL